MKPKSVPLEINKIKPLIRLNRKNKKTQITNIIRNGRGYITTDPGGIKWIIREYYEQLLPISSTIHKNNTIMTKWDLSWECKTCSIFKKSINVIQYINRLKKKNYMIISIDTKEAFGKSQHPFMIKNSQRSRNRGSFLNLIKGIYKNPTVNIILNDK